MKAIIVITDQDTEAKVKISFFDDGFCRDSQAHRLAEKMLTAVATPEQLKSAKIQAEKI